MRRLERAVFPVFRYYRSSKPEEELRSRDGDFRGTGFFVERGEHVAFVTARHVVDVEADDGWIGVGDLGDNSKHNFGGFDYHPTADLAIAVFERAKAPTFAVPLAIGSERLALGDPVASYGFPLSGAKRQVDGHNLVRIEQMFFRGHVRTDWVREDLAGLVPRAFGVNYGLSFSVPTGLSGGPLVTVNADGVPSVAGMAYGNRIIEFQLRTYEEVARDGAVERTREVDAHHFGLASDLAELLSMIE